MPECCQGIEHTILVSDIPPCTNYSGGIFIDHILQSVKYKIKNAFIVLNPALEPVLSPTAQSGLQIKTASKPREYHDPALPVETRCAAERVAAARIRDEILPQVLELIEAAGAKTLWVLLEGQSMIRLAHLLQQCSGLPMLVQVMDPPLNWLRANNVDATTQQALLDQYESVLRHASSCAAASWEMARSYEALYGVKAFAVVPSLAPGLARPPRTRPGGGSVLKIAMIGQIYARDEWNVLIAAMERLGWSVHGKAIRVHVFTHDFLDPVLLEQGFIVRETWQPTATLLGQLHDMDLMYCPYRFDPRFREEAELCFPSKLTTYLASGRPVLFHGPEYASPAKFLGMGAAAILCHALDPAELAVHLQSIFGDPKQYRRIAHAGRRMFDRFLSDQYLSGEIRSAFQFATQPTPPVERKRAGRRKIAPADDRRPIILVIAFGESVHTARWLNMVSQSEFRFVLCPIYACPPSKDFRDVRVVRTLQDMAQLPPGAIAFFDLESVDAGGLAEVDHAIDFAPFRPGWLPTSFRFTHPAHVVEAVRRFRPVAIHSMEVQFAGYLTLAAKDYLGREMPRWLLSNWGSDIYLYRKLPAHAARLSRVIKSIDGYMAECGRDVSIVRELGFTGPVGPTIPASGGIDFTDFPALAQFEPPSKRQEIHLKGYHGWSGRALNILSAIHLASPALRGFRIRITLGNPQVAEMARALCRTDGLDVTCEPYLPSYKDAILRLGQARISIGLGISDGISTTLLESMAVGTFPIKGSTSCADEWVRGTTGFVVSPHDVRGLADVLVQAATDDDLVDDAAPVNRHIVERRWNAKGNGEVFLPFLRKFLADRAVPMGQRAYS